MRTSVGLLALTAVSVHWITVDDPPDKGLDYSVTLELHYSATKKCCSLHGEGTNELCSIVALLFPEPGYLLTRKRICIPAAFNTYRP